VSQCSICQQVKTETKRPAGLLKPLLVPSHLQENLSLDFIISLPLSEGHSTILVIVDHFSKGIHLGFLRPHYTTFKVDALFFDLVCKLHGFPRSLVSDCDPIFISQFLCELFRLCGTKLRMITSYHLEFDGQIEVFNHVLEQYLRAFVHDKPSIWSTFLSLAKWSYNTFVHSGIGLTPFKVTYEKPPPSLPNYLLGSSNVEAVDVVLTSREVMHTLLLKRLTKAQADMKCFADSKRYNVYYSVGE